MIRNCALGGGGLWAAATESAVGSISEGWWHPFVGIYEHTSVIRGISCSPVSAQRGKQAFICITVDCCGLKYQHPELSFSWEADNVFGNKTKKIINKPDSSQYMTMETRNQKRKQNPSNLGREIFEIEKKRSLFENFVLKIHQRSVFSNVLWKRHLVQQPWSLGLGVGLPYPVQTEARGPRHPMISGARKSSGWVLRKRSICELNFYWEDIPSDLE